MVAMGMLGRAFPLRLCYSANVFRYEPEHAGRDREIFQLGIELIGAKGTAADVEPIMVAAECLHRLGITAFTVAIGEGAFFNALLRKTGVAVPVQRGLREAAARKDVPRMTMLLRKAGVKGGAAKALLAVPELYGGEEILEAAARLAPRTDGCQHALDRLREVWNQLAKAGLGKCLLVDMGEIRRMEYYTGLVFDIYAEGLGSEVGGGGRYDHLIGRFGREVPSTGFAFDLDRLLQLRASQAKPAAAAGNKRNRR
jgi:ATP phosphoribosyltransferase regulatory subunit